jgi:hypothetical protein
MDMRKVKENPRMKLASDPKITKVFVWLLL